MRAIVHTGAGDVSVLALKEVETPIPAAQQIRVKVAASGLNRADLLQRRGRYPAPAGWPAEIPGLEYAGVVESVAPDVTRWKVGDRVMGLVGGGGQAEFVVVHQDEAIAVPGNLTLQGAAAIPEAFLTAWDALVNRGRLAPGERVLIHAVGSGVGTAAVQLARQLGATTVGTSRSASKLARVIELGLDEGIDTATQGFGGRLSAPVDVILDVLGGPAFADNLDALAPRGRLVLLGLMQGAKADASLEPILRKRLEVIGSVMRTRVHEERSALAAAFSRQVLPWFEANLVRPVVEATYAVSRIGEAHTVMERDQNFGKLVLTW